jgi:hypothetical protein
VQPHCRGCALFCPLKKSIARRYRRCGGGAKGDRVSPSQRPSKDPKCPSLRTIMHSRPDAPKDGNFPKHPALPAVLEAIWQCPGSAAALPALPPALPRQCRSAVLCSPHCRQGSCTDFLRVALPLHCRGSARLPRHCFAPPGQPAPPPALFAPLDQAGLRAPHSSPFPPVATSNDAPQAHTISAKGSGAPTPPAVLPLATARQRMPDSPQQSLESLPIPCEAIAKQIPQLPHIQISNTLPS